MLTVSLSRSLQPTSTEVETVGRDWVQQESAAHHGHHGDLYCASHRSSTVCQRSARVCEGCSQTKVERKRDSLPRCESFMQVIGGHAFVLIQCLRSLAPRSAARTAMMRSRSDNVWPCGMISSSYCRLLCCGLSKHVRRVPSQCVMCASLSKE